MTNKFQTLTFKIQTKITETYSFEIFRFDFCYLFDPWNLSFGI
jgi:hypothetical protein